MAFPRRSRTRLGWPSLLLLLGCWSSAQAQSAADSVDLLVHQARRQLRAPGLQLAVVRHGRIVKLGSYGVANGQGFVLATTQTRFFLDAITRAFVSVAAM